LPFEDLVRTDAVRLFAARARAVDPSFQLTEEAARDVAGICRRLDGLPLAIELAAARTRILSPAALATRLDPSLELLVGGPRDVPQRHQTLRATLDWSYELLEAPERRLLARLSVFAGGWTLDAAAAVCADGGDPLELLSVLVDVSLLRRRAGEREQGFAMLETIRQYAVERLVASGEEQLLRRRHAEYFLAVAEQARELFSSGKADEAVYASLDLEHENLRAALRWAGEHGDVELEVRLATALRQFWIVRGYLSEGRRFFAAAVERTAVGDPRLRAEARMHGGAFPYRQGDLATAKAWWQEALELLRDSGDADAIARCAGELGAVAFSEGDLVRATALLQEAGTRFQEVGDRMRFGIVASNLAEVSVMRGELQEALRYAEQGVSNGRAVGDRDGLAVALYGLGRIQKLLGDDVAARQTFGESLVYGRSVGYREVIANCVEAAAEFALADGDAPLAHRLLVVSRAALEEMGVRLQGIEGEAFATTLAALDEQLDAAVRESIEAEAATERVDDVADQALVILQFS
jgi:predicted ATPase